MGRPALPSALDPAGCVMGAGVATSPHFPGVDPLSRRTGLLPWADRVPAWSEDPASSFSGFQSKHCCSGRSPFELSSKYRYFADNSFAFPLPEGAGSAGRSGSPLSAVGFHLGLEPVPRSPCQSLFRGVHPFGCLPLPGGGSGLKVRPFPVDRFWPHKEDVTPVRVAQTDSACG